ncbi:hypothetical protein [Haliangium sp.]|uniref:hypothetical protein n=1 Tax=Haliangium sp. TaxID=2663208 RepID=UPI003D14EA9C
MPNERDDTRLATPSQLLFDVLTHIEQLRRTLADTEAMTHGANATLARLPYMPWPGQTTLSHSSAAKPARVPSHAEPAPAIDAGTREHALEQRLDVGRLNTYVIASAASMRDVMDECDRLIAHTRRRIEEVRGMRMATDHASRVLDPAKVARAARAAARRPTTPKPEHADSAEAPKPVSFLGGGLDRGGRRWPGTRPRSSVVAQVPERGVFAAVTARNCPTRR